MMRVATTLLSPVEMGRVSLVLTTTAFYALFLVNPVGMFINRRLHAWQISGVAKEYLIFYVNYLLLVVVIAAASLFLLQTIKLNDFGLSATWLIVLVCGSLLFNTINQTVIPSLNLLGESKKFVFLTVATIAASFVFATLFVKLTEPTAQYWLFGVLAGQALLGVIGAKIFFAVLQIQKVPYTQPTIHKKHLKVLFNFAWPVAIAAGLGWVQGQGYRYIMEEQLGLAALGLFVAGYSISLGMTAAFESILTTYFQPRLYRDANTGNSDTQAQAWRRYATVVIPSLILTVAFITALAPELTRLLLGENFQAAKEFVIWGALAESMRVLIGVYTLIAHVYMRTNWLILPTLIGASLSIILCLVLIPDFGASGAGMALVLSGLAVVIAMHLLLAKKVGGGISIYPVLKAGFCAAGLYGLVLTIRYWFNSKEWAAVICILVLASIIYFGLQYFFLQTHLTEKEEA